MLSTTRPYEAVTRRWWVVALLTLLGAIAGYLFSALAQPTYVARAYVVAVARGAGDNASAASYAEAYSKVASQGEVVAAAVNASGGNVQADEVRHQVHATAASQGPVIEIAGQAADPQRASDLANMVGAGVISVSTRQSDRTRVDLILLSQADPPADPVSPRPVIDVAVGASIGLLLGGLFMMTRAERERGRARPISGQPINAAPTEPDRRTDAMVSEVDEVRP